MSQLTTASLTALFGIVVFVSGQIVQTFFLSQIHEQRKVLGEIAFVLLYLANISDVAKLKSQNIPLLELEDAVQAAKTLRRLAGQLRGSLWTIPCYGFFTFLRIVPNRQSVIIASQHLVGWSNSLHHGDPTIHKDEIAQALKMTLNT